MLARELVSVATPAGEVAVKLVTRPGGERTAKAEIDAAARRPRAVTRRVRARRRQRRRDALRGGAG